jgi:protease I
MASKDTTEAKPELDEDGLVIHHYDRTVLVVVPPRDYAETGMRYTRSALYNIEVRTIPVSVDDDKEIPGQLQDSFQPDGCLRDTKLDEFVGVVFVAGDGALELADDPDAQRLARQAHEQDKPICAWGNSLALLAKAGVLANRKVTGAPELREMIEKAGGRYVDTQYLVDGKLVTAVDDSAGHRMAVAFADLFRGK